MEGHKLNKIERNPVHFMLKPAVSPTVAGDIGRRFVADRQGGRTPQHPCVVVAQVECFARTIGHRIVEPGGELVLPTIGRPGGAAAFGPDQKTETGVGDDVDPGCWRHLHQDRESSHILYRSGRTHPIR